MVLRSLRLPGSTRAAPTLRAGVGLVAARVNFRAENRHLFGRLDAEFDDMAINSSHLHPDGVPNDEFFINLAG
jgi:hypothetical protein